MGLDISCVTNLELVEENSQNYYDYDYYTQALIFHGQFPERCGDLVPGLYNCERQEGFRAGSYSGYNSWREQLCELVNDAAPCEIWENEPRFKDSPFYELIHFSDCEGCLGTEVCQKLLEDFEEWEALAKVYNDEQGHPVDYWFYERFKNFHHVVKLAAENNGAVIFH